MGVPEPERPARHPRRSSTSSPSTPPTPSSIVGSLVAARENARGIREVLSSEMWECLNATYNALPAEVGGPPAVSAPTPSSRTSRSGPAMWPAWPTPP